MFATLLDGAAAPMAMHIVALVTLAATSVQVNQPMHVAQEGCRPIHGKEKSVKKVGGMTCVAGGG